MDVFSIRIVLVALLAACPAIGAFAAEKTVTVTDVKGTRHAEVTYDDPLGRNTPQRSTRQRVNGVNGASIKL